MCVSAMVPMLACPAVPPTEYNIDTVVGGGPYPYTDGVAALQAGLNYPSGITLDRATGDLFVMSGYNQISHYVAASKTLHALPVSSTYVSSGITLYEDNLYYFNSNDPGYLARIPKGSSAGNVPQTMVMTGMCRPIGNVAFDGHGSMYYGVRTGSCSNFAGVKRLNLTTPEAPPSVVWTLTASQNCALYNLRLKGGYLYLSCLDGHFIARKNLATGQVLELVPEATGIRPRGLDVDAWGNVVFATDAYGTNLSYSHRIMRVSATGALTTLAGTGAEGTTPNGDGGLATLAKLGAPEDLVMDQSTGVIYFTDTLQKLVRKLTPKTIPAPPQLSGEHHALHQVHAAGPCNRPRAYACMHMTCLVTH